MQNYKLPCSDCSVKDFQHQFNIKDTIFAAIIAWSDTNNVTLHRAWQKLWSKVTAENLIEDYEDIDQPSTAHSQVVWG